LIYDFPAEEESIRQGDIFLDLPRLDFSLERLLVLREDGTAVETKWSQVRADGSPLTIIAGAKPAAAIVASQDCDAQQAPDVTLCEIRPFQDVERRSRETRSPGKWASIVTQHCRTNQKWFYLPPDERVGFDRKMAVDFLVTMRVRRTELEGLRSLRRGRLNSQAEEHFRERIAQFFRRYAYDEWYALDREEFASYEKSHRGVRPKPWQDFRS
jgi:hypothetical protein